MASRSRAAAPRAAASARPGMIYRPVRERDPEQIVDTRRQRASRRAATTRPALTSLSTADYSCISPLVKQRHGASCGREKVSLSASLAARLRARRGPARRDRAACARPVSPSRPRPAPSACATWSTRTSPRRTSSTTAPPRLRARLEAHEALLHDRPAHREDEDVAGIVETGPRACSEIGRELPPAARRGSPSR